MFEIGTTLREARLRHRIDLVEAEQDTKIRSKYLSALETEDFDILPGTVYARGFLRTYARYLGLDSQLFIDEYNARFGQFEDLEDAAVRRGVASRAPVRRFSFRKVMVMSLVALAGIAWLGLRDAGAPPRDTSDTVSSRPTTTPPANSMLDRHDVVRHHAPRVAGITVSARGGITWIEVRRGSARGAVIFSGNLADGSRRHFEDPRQLVVTVGAPSQTILRGADRTIRSSSSTTEQWVITPQRISRLRVA